jgi:hypothetical protein
MLQQPSITDGWTDDDIVERIRTAPPLQDAIYVIGKGTNAIIGRNVVDLCPDTVAKFGEPYPFLCPEARALNFVRSNTSIPVPKVRRYITSGMHGYLLLEKIEGTRLDKVWPSLSPLQRLLTAWTLRGYILELRKASNAYHRSYVIGPMADTPQQCHGPAWLWAYRDRGPFESTRELLDWFTDGQEYGLRFDDSYDSQPLVLTHGDLCMRNIIVGRDGKLWLVDWEWSGFYPPFCEYVATMSAADRDKPPRTWQRCIPLITGAWVKELRMLGQWEWEV